MEGSQRGYVALVRRPLSDRWEQAWVQDTTSAGAMRQFEQRYGQGNVQSIFEYKGDSSRIQRGYASPGDGESSGGSLRLGSFPFWFFVVTTLLGLVFGTGVKCDHIYTGGCPEASSLTKIVPVAPVLTPDDEDNN